MRPPKYLYQSTSERSDQDDSGGTSGNPELGNVTRELEEFDTPKVTAAIGSQGGYVKWDVRWGHPPRDV